MRSYASYYIWNHRQLDRDFNSLIRPTWRKTSKLFISNSFWGAFAHSLKLWRRTGRTITCGFDCVFPSIAASGLGALINWALLQCRFNVIMTLSLRHVSVGMFVYTCGQNIVPNYGNIYHRSNSVTHLWHWETFESPTKRLCSEGGTLVMLPEVGQESDGVLTKSELSEYLR